MIVYSIFVRGEADCVDGGFKCHSKNVYTHKPSQEEIDKFVQTCSTGCFINLNIKKPYETQIIEHTVIEN